MRKNSSSVSDRRGENRREKNRMLAEINSRDDNLRYESLEEIQTKLDHQISRVSRLLPSFMNRNSYFRQFGIFEDSSNSKHSIEDASNSRRMTLRSRNSQNDANLSSAHSNTSRALNNSGRANRQVQTALQSNENSNQSVMRQTRSQTNAITSFEGLIGRGNTNNNSSIRNSNNTSNNRFHQNHSNQNLNSIFSKPHLGVTTRSSTTQSNSQHINNENLNSGAKVLNGNMTLRSRTNGQIPRTVSKDASTWATSNSHNHRHDGFHHQCGSNNQHNVSQLSATVSESGKRKRPFELPSFEEDKEGNLLVSSSNLSMINTRRNSYVMIDEKIEKKQKTNSAETPEDRRAALIMMEAETSMGSSEMQEEALFPRRSGRLNKNLVVYDEKEEDDRRDDENSPKTQRQRLKRLVHNKRESKLNSAVKPALDACSVCLTDITGEIGKLICNHHFCFSCIKDWSDVTNLCPLCKVEFAEIVKTDHGGNELDRIEVEAKKMIIDEDDVQYYEDDADDQCYICEQGNNEYLMLVCDRCNFYCCHTYCLTPPMDTIPDEEWYCDYCLECMSEEAIMEDESSRVRMTRSRTANLRDDASNDNSRNANNNRPPRPPRRNLPPRNRNNENRGNINNAERRNERARATARDDASMTPVRRGQAERNRGRRFTTFLDNIVNEATNENRLRRSMRLRRQRQEEDNSRNHSLAEDKEELLSDEDDEEEEKEVDETLDDSRMEEEVPVPGLRTPIRRPSTRNQISEEQLRVIRRGDNINQARNTRVREFDHDQPSHSSRRVLRSSTQGASINIGRGRLVSIKDEEMSSGEEASPRGVITRSKLQNNNTTTIPTRRSVTMEDPHQGLRYSTRLRSSAR